MLTPAQVAAVQARAVFDCLKAQRGIIAPWQDEQSLQGAIAVIAAALAQARAEGRREERDAWMRKFPVAIPPGEKERPEQERDQVQAMLARQKEGA
jgi:hypothetical protein